MTSQRIDGYLSRIAQQLDATSLVLVSITDGVEEWILQRNKQENLGLGDNYHLAEQGVRALMRAHREMMALPRSTS